MQVIIGKNGSGKSTILKLATRIYDPCEGSIFLDGQDIKTLKLKDLHNAIAVLFQDYTHFPVSVRVFTLHDAFPVELHTKVGFNIGLGDPEHATSTSQIKEAARMGGADEIIEKLADGYDTYLDAPVHYDSNGDARRTLRTLLKTEGKIRSTAPTSLSGGQLQRIAMCVRKHNIWALR